MRATRGRPRRAWALLLLATCLPHAAGRTFAEEDALGGPGDHPRSIAAAADDVVKAFGASDAAALVAAARTRAPDPWLVAHELCERDQYQAALELANAEPGPRTERLAAYIESRRGVPGDGAARAALPPALAAAGQGDWKRLRASAGALADRIDNTLRIQLTYLVGLATERLREDGAVDLLASAAGAARKIGWLARAAEAYYQAGLSAYRRSEYARALPLLEAAVRTYESLADDAARADALRRLGHLHRRTGRYDQALDQYETAHALFRKLEDVAGIAKTLRAIGIVHEERGALAVALDHYERALAMLNEHEGSSERLGALESVGIGRYNLGDYRGAKNVFQEVLRAWGRRDDPVRSARTLINLGAAYKALGDRPRALKHLRRALALNRRLKSPSGEASVLLNMGVVHAGMGDFLAALGTYEQALQIYRRIDEPRGEALLLGNYGELYASLGDYENSRDYRQRARIIWKRLGDRVGEADSLLALGATEAVYGDLESALESQGKALEIAKETEYLRGEANALRGLGELHLGLGHRDEALDLLTQAGNVYARLGDKAGAAEALAQLGRAHDAFGDAATAVTLLKEAVDDAWTLRATSLHVRALGYLARALLDTGDAKGALATAERALPSLEQLLGGLSEEEGASARELHLDVLSAGTLAAARLDEPRGMIKFLESGRASLLLESLDGRGALEWDDLPEALRIAEADAKAAVARARHEYSQARQSGKREQRATAMRVLEAAQKERVQVSGRIQREAKREAQLFYPRAAPLDEIQALLAPGTALVMYALSLDEALALVLTTDSEQIVMLGKAPAITSSCSGLKTDDESATCEADLKRLQKLLVDPLKLPKSIETVLISPEGPLCYLPYGAIFADHIVALTPSGTTHVSLSEDAGLGKRVLALGNPQYGAKVDAGAKQLYQRRDGLRPLPASKAEAIAVGDDVLLGPAATEAGLREALKQERRWRAVHLACHGRINVDRPTLSSLALTQGGSDDGFLTCLEVLRMRIPADLVVLSACDTGKGKLVQGEGIVGLTRTFMYAGSQRVVCSLWKVDDAATSALMQKFYELWHPRPKRVGPEPEKRAEGEPEKGLGAAAALKAAQAFIRNHPEHPKWRHPYYWAAWTLWGLPQ